MGVHGRQPRFQGPHEALDAVLEVLELVLCRTREGLHLAQVLLAVLLDLLAECGHFDAEALR